MQRKSKTAQPEDLPGRQEHILVVDDESVTLGLIISLLERSGYDVTPAVDAERALRHLQDDPGCRLVLADVMLPGADGLTLLDSICTNHPGLPVVILTAAHDVHVAVSAFRRGAVDFLLKPFDHSQLLAAVAHALEHGRLQQQNAAYRQNLEEIITARTSRLRATMHDLERSYDFTLEVMGDALDLRDAETEGHSRRVTAYTIALARKIGLNAEQLRVIARGAFLHDVGKIATPDRILLKPGKLDPEETEIMRQHCALGYQMVRKIPFLREASEIIYTHQETFDGSGYPRGLRGEAIPLGARIFAIADTLDAMTSDRPYRKALSFGQARAEIVRCSGTQFDPGIVQVFLTMPETLWSSLRREVELGSSDALAIAV
ncbi:MAG: HD domain-containing phosphohydrolase [Acidobacteriaceae bacterium]|jgi:putative nucleotidyltransferase with HDIG domain